MELEKIYVNSKIKEEIKKSNFSQNKVARLLNIDSSKFSKILNGKLKIRIDKLDMLLRVLNIYDKYKEELFNDFYLKQEQINEIEYFSLEDEIKDKKKDKLWKLSDVIW